MTLAAQFFALTPKRRGLVFEQAAAGQAGHAVMLEKDFWVSWLLGLLFSDPELGPHLVFKGGTSLFARAWARYDVAVHGSFRLVPPTERHAALAQDYAEMRSMFMSEPPPFAELMERLAQAEARLNQP